MVDKLLFQIAVVFFLILFLVVCPMKSAVSSENIYINSIGMEFVLIPSGKFIMGSPPHEIGRDGKGREQQHEVVIGRPFYIQTTEVTLKQWRSIMGKKLFSKRKGADDMPVVKVSWYDCINFIKRLNKLNEGVYRLPTEAEWEYACRAGSSTAYFWGDTIDCSKAMYGNKKSKSKECIDYVKSKKLTINQATRVKSYSPNAWGLYDMHGNVWEWCQDLFLDYSNEYTQDPKGDYLDTIRTKRGGSWSSEGWSCRSANRAHAHPAYRIKSTGFRLVREVD